MKLSDIAAKLDCRLEAPSDVEITGVAGLEEAQPGQIAFLANKRYTPLLRTTRASAVFVDDKVSVSRDPGQALLALVRSNNPYLAFARALELFYQAPTYTPGIHPSAVIAASAKIGANAHIGPHCFVDENVVIGKNAVLHSSVSIYRGAHIGDDFFAHSHTVVREFCRVGNRVILQNGAVIGADGLGFAKRKDGTWHKIVQSGPAVLEDDVEIQANSCIDRATVGETRIGHGTKIDDLVLIGHACSVGPDSMLCGQTGLAGSTTTGRGVIFAGQTASSGHLHVGEGTIVTAKSALPGDTPPHSIQSGSPAVDNKLWLRVTAAMNRLPDLVKRVRELEGELAALKAK
ncbi:MAG: UDP-3-O-(3-hydroxymyristoyl)glucosamine N-acyltransferase [Acidobacteria bacterium]|nr:UDP-3-O-(3-hydroxymyristoyl)glucosamine N-acyltransferase [Acidobacteriota bacterium]MBS1867788.1 UDP-3-O-(3-hydroxymyristoyl)glucosamine N-acyltransferase [Acidobacteriota bacterium]